MSLDVDGIVSLFEKRASSQYGREPVNQLEHALQCAHLAERAGETSETVAAALLHDLGHLIAAERDGVLDDTQESDDLHQYIALPFLRGLFPEAVLEPIRLHVDAKRYLCAVDHAYWSGLSDGSRRSLVLQGGPFDPQEQAQFIAQPFAEEALRLRRYDDLAKVPDKVSPDLGHFVSVLHQVRCTDAV